MSRLNHPNVLRFYGLVTQGRMVVGIMTEFAGGGSLAAALRSGLVPGGIIPLRRRAQLALHAVNGMAYLHSQRVGRLAGRHHVNPRPCSRAPPPSVHAAVTSRASRLRLQCRSPVQCPAHAGVTRSEQSSRC